MVTKTSVKCKRNLVYLVDFVYLVCFVYLVYCVHLVTRFIDKAKYRGVTLT